MVRVRVSVRVRVRVRVRVGLTLTLGWAIDQRDQQIEEREYVHALGAHGGARHVRGRHRLAQVADEAHHHRRRPEPGA